MARVIVITSGKGGVGKTTTTSNIGMALASLGHRTLLIDADVGLRNLDLLLGLENRIIYTGIDILNERCRLEQALLKDKRQENLTFFPLSGSQPTDPLTNLQVQRLIDLVEKDYDFILIDSPAGIDEGFRVAMNVANEAIVVVTPEVPSIRDADKVIGLLMSNNVRKVSLLINRFRPSMVMADNMMSIEDVKNILGLPLIGVIPESEEIIIASNRGEPLVLEKNLSLPGLALSDTAKRLSGEKREFLDLNRTISKNPVKRFFGSLRTKADT